MIKNTNILKESIEYRVYSIEYRVKKAKEKIEKVAFSFYLTIPLKHRPAYAVLVANFFKYFLRIASKPNLLTRVLANI